MKKKNKTGLAGFLLLIFYFLLLSSCSIEKQISKSANENVLSNKALTTAHVGISIFEPAANKYWFNYKGDKYFVPASNTKLPTCYAAMKYLGDSLVGLRYGIPEEYIYKDSLIVIKPTGDPTFLHDDFVNQRVYDFIEFNSKHQKRFGILVTLGAPQRWGSGWSWNDYEESYMAERNTFPVSGNTVTFRLKNFTQENKIDTSKTEELFLGNLFKTNNIYFDSLINTYEVLAFSMKTVSTKKIQISRSIDSNDFGVYSSDHLFTPTTIPFATNGILTTLRILSHKVGKSFSYVLDDLRGDGKYLWMGGNPDEQFDKEPKHPTIKKWYTIHSQPTDSLLKPMMHRSDNFFAEQSLLMVSNERLGIMNDAKIIDTLLKTDFKDLPQKPRWVDGSGLSRYNLFTPQDFVAILNKMKNEFGMDRIKVILATGGEGTISSYYKADSGFIYGKTGTLSGVVAFSGFLYTKKGKLLIFSTLVNNHQASSTDVRRAMEKFLQGIRNSY